MIGTWKKYVNAMMKQLKEHVSLEGECENARSIQQKRFRNHGYIL